MPTRQSPKPHASQTGSSTISSTSSFRVAVIGPASSEEQRDVLAYLTRHPMLDVVDHLPELPQSADAVNVPLIVVLQSFSDQFGQETVNRLIEQTLGKRIYCCYDAWCASDGRAFDVWPPALRIPVTEFPDFLEREVKRMLRREPPLPPTAAGEELFARWYGRQPDDS